MSLDLGFKLRVLRVYCTVSRLGLGVNGDGEDRYSIYINLTFFSRLCTSNFIMYNVSIMIIISTAEYSTIYSKT